MNDVDALWAFLVAAAVAFALTPLGGARSRAASARLRAARARPARPADAAPGRAGDPGRRCSSPALLFLPAERGDARHPRRRDGDRARRRARRPLRRLHPFVKLAGQFAAALIPCSADVRVENVTLPFIDPIELGDTGGSALTLVGIVAVMNVVNFTDGVDGLAAGVCTIAAATFAVIALSLDRVDAGILAALTAGAAIGFLWHNFHPASIFMGDSGSNLLGLLLACVAIQGVLKTAAVVALFFPLVILAVPILDTAFVVAKRIKYRRPVHQADR